MWDSMQEEGIESAMDVPSDSTGIHVNGSFIQVEPGESFVDAVKNIASDAGLGKFRVRLNGEEIQPGDAPESFNEGTKVELHPYEVAG